MKTNQFSQAQNQEPAGASRPAAAEELNQNRIDFTPSADEVARRAYFSHVNEGSLQGQEVQHWLAAEAELIAERKLTRVHGFHNPTWNRIHRQPTEKESIYGNTHRSPRGNTQNV